MSVSLRDIVLSVRYGDAALVGESAGYLVLAATDLALALPRQFGLDSLHVFEDGHVDVDASPCSHPEAEAQLRRLLVQLLGLVRTACPNLSRVAERMQTRGLHGLQRELEAALVPVNRKAARRSLARLVRDAKKSAERTQAAGWAQPLVPATIAPPCGDTPPDLSFGAPEVESPTPFVVPPAAALPTLGEVELSGPPCGAQLVTGGGGRAAGHGPRPIPGTGVMDPSRDSATRALPPEVVCQLAFATPVPEWETRDRTDQSRPTCRVQDPAAEEQLVAVDMTLTHVRAPVSPPDLEIDTTPTELYARAVERRVLHAPTLPVLDLSKTPPVARALDMSETPELAEVSAHVARRAEEEHRAQARAAPTVPPAQGTPQPEPVSQATSHPPAAHGRPQPVSQFTPGATAEPAQAEQVPLLHSLAGDTQARRPSGLEELLANLALPDRPEREVYQDLKQLSRVDLSPFSPPVGSTWMRNKTGAF